MTRDKQWFAVGPNDAQDRLLSVVPNLPVVEAGWTALGAAACSARFPASPGNDACFITQTEWSHAAMLVHLSYWEVGTDPERRYWLLWRSCLEDPRQLAQRMRPTVDGAGAARYRPLWHSRPVAACERAEIGIRDAAVLLLRLLRLDATAAPDFYDATSLVSKVELLELARQVWGD